MSSAEGEARREFAGVAFDPIDTDQAVAWLATRRATDPFAYVVTPNVDHMVRLEERPELKPLYARASLCLCDSRVLSRLARLYGLRLPVAPGSDLTARLLQEVVEPGDRIHLVGGKADDLAALRQLLPGLQLTQTIPPLGLRDNAAARLDAAHSVTGGGARFILVAVGSPQQEQIAALIGEQPGALGTALCIGASIDFLTGAEQRAPRAFQRAGLEWAWRLASNPRRLWRRYLVEGATILPIVRRWARSRKP